MAKKKKAGITVGKRKKAIARATVKPGIGTVRINGKLLSTVEPEMVRMMIMEPLMIAEKASKELDINVDVMGGGIIGQASAIRQAIAKALIQHDKNLKQKFVEYDRTLLVADSRRTEPHKPSASKRGPRRHKQRSKR